MAAGHKARAARVARASTFPQAWGDAARWFPPRDIAPSVPRRVGWSKIGSWERELEQAEAGKPESLIVRLCLVLRGHVPERGFPVAERDLDRLTRLLNLRLTLHTRHGNAKVKDVALASRIHFVYGAIKFWFRERSDQRIAEFIAQGLHDSYGIEISPNRILEDINRRKSTRKSVKSELR